MTTDPRALAQQTRIAVTLEAIDRHLAQIVAAVSKLMPEVMTDQEFAAELERRLAEMDPHAAEQMLRKALWTFPKDAGGPRV